VNSGAIGLTAPDRRTLLALARAAIGEESRSDGSLDRTLRSAELTPALRTRAAVFVSLRRPDPAVGGRVLRGCIGTLSAEQPLFESVMRHARLAAFQDPRFPPVRPEELADLVVEISVLTPSRPVDDPAEIVPGRDGVSLEAGAARSVFLPQVASEQGWDRTQLLEQLARKAGLPADGWRGARLSVFQAEAFEEEIPSPAHY
jgi:AmmeMemoRadiSam system protein A